MNTSKGTHNPTYSYVRKRKYLNATYHSIYFGKAEFSLKEVLGIFLPFGIYKLLTECDQLNAEWHC